MKIKFSRVLRGLSRPPWFIEVLHLVRSMVMSSDFSAQGKPSFDHQPALIYHPSVVLLFVRLSVKTKETQWLVLYMSLRFLATFP